ncbi:MAG: FtsB family cell division protein [Actinomycetes bacterium]
MAGRRPTAPRGPRRGGGSASGAPRQEGSRRPAPAARPRSTPAPEVPETPRGLTRRAAVFAVLVLAAAVVLAPYLRTLSEQQATLAALEAEVAQRERDVADLEAQLERWEDPAFVAARARERLYMVMPGETGYVVLDPPAPDDRPEAAEAAAQAAEASGTERPWFGTLWESVELAGVDVPATRPAPDVGEEPEPAPAPSVPPTTP